MVLLVIIIFETLFFFLSLIKSSFQVSFFLSSSLFLSIISSPSFFLPLFSFYNFFLFCFFCCLSIAIIMIIVIIKISNHVCQSNHNYISVMFKGYYIYIIYCIHYISYTLSTTSLSLLPFFSSFIPDHPTNEPLRCSSLISMYENMRLDTSSLFTIIAHLSYFICVCIWFCCIWFAPNKYIVVISFPMIQTILVMSRVWGLKEFNFCVFQEIWSQSHSQRLDTAYDSSHSLLFLPFLPFLP